MSARGRSDRLRSRAVAWLKIVLPLIALALLSTLFLVARRIDPSDAIPYAEVDVEERARAPRITAPTYAGQTADGATVTFTAAEARPGGDGTAASALTLSARLETPDGGGSGLSADAARLDNAARNLVLSGSVILKNSSGWQVRTDALTVALDRTGLQSGGPVTATGPAGVLSADRMTLVQNAAPDPGGVAANGGSYVLVFNGSVKLVYEPRSAAQRP